MSTVRAKGFTFPIGYEEFHKNPLYNFQMNRPYSWGYARRADLFEAGQRVNSFAEWKAEMARQAKAAKSDGRILNAAFYYRAAEFYTSQNDPDKTMFYEEFSELFYCACEAYGFERQNVPYKGSWLPALVLEPVTELKGTVIFHGGYDSFIEEFFSMMHELRLAGYRVIGFDGPGQGAARRKNGLVMDYRWEKPVGAVIDHFELDQVSLIGLSLGGWFALRAAAHEPRVQSVIVSGNSYDYRKVAPPAATWLLEFFRDHFRGFTNRLSHWKIRRGGIESWSIGHLMYILDTDEPMAGLDWAFSMNEANLNADRITQDVLVLAGREDHFIPFRLHKKLLGCLTSAKSVTDHVFNREDNAHNHSQVGNIGLALDVMKEWLDKVHLD